jgi:uncharacterized protein (UPF0332 family)
VKDISEHLHNAHVALKAVYELVNEKKLNEAIQHAEDALFHSRCAMLWLKERTDDPTGE